MSKVKGEDGSKTKYKLSIACLFRNSVLFLKEWIEFHKLVGVEHFYLANHLSEDDYDSVLKPYIEKGEVELIELTNEFHPSLYEEYVHVPFYRRILKIAKETSEWVALIDIDEFIVPVEKQSILEVLQEFKDEAAVAIHWQIYGTSGVHKVPDGKLITEVLTRKAPTQHPQNRYVKVIVKPSKVVELIDPHIARCESPFKTVKMDGTVIGEKSTHLKVTIDKLRINHYYTGDLDYSETYKVPFYVRYVGRGEEAARFMTIRGRYGLYNDVEDRIMDRFVPALRPLVIQDSEQPKVGKGRYFWAGEIEREYENAREERNDIYDHVPILYHYAKECQHITRCASGGCASTWPFLKGLLHNTQLMKRMVSIDAEFHPGNEKTRCFAQGVGISFHFIKGNDVNVPLEQTDLLFINTWHVYAHLKRELETHHEKVNKWIVIHNTAIDAHFGESIRLGMDVVRQAIDTGYPIAEIQIGLQKAIEEFLERHPKEWRLENKWTNCNGLTVLKRIQ